MPNLDDLRDGASIPATLNPNSSFWASIFDLNYAFGQVVLTKEAVTHCVIAIVGGRCTGYYRFNRGFYGLADMPVIFQDKMDRNLSGSALAWPDDMLVVTRGPINEHFSAVRDVLRRLDDNGYKVSLKKSKIFQKTVERCCFEISEEGVTPKASRAEAIQKIQPPKTLLDL